MFRELELIFNHFHAFVGACFLEQSPSSREVKGGDNHGSRIELDSYLGGFCKVFLWIFVQKEAKSPR